MKWLHYLALGALLAGLTLTGCGTRQAVNAAQEGQQPQDIPDDQGGFAGKLAAPPDEIAKIDVEKVIDEGRLSDSKDPVKEPDVDEHAAEAPKPEPKPEPAAKDDSGPDHSQDTSWDSVKNPVVGVQTDKGIFYLELWPDVAPKHVANFLKLVKMKFYDGIVAHRVIPGFVMQAGDPLTKELPLDDPRIGSGGPGWSVDAEFSNKPHVRGTLSMARSEDPNSAGSQFYVCYDRLPDLDGKYTVFGQTLGTGMTIVDEITKGDRIRYMWVVHES